MKALMRTLVGALGVMVVAGCSNYGSVQLPPDRLSYNTSLQYSDTQQIVLNIVRLRYTDIPYFLTVNNVVSQFSYSRTGSLNIANNTSSPPALSGSANGAVSLSESPTLTYTPLQGEDYAKRLLAPIDLSVLYQLIRSGWGVDKILRLLIQRLGPYDNASLASRQTSERAPTYEAFQAWGLMMRDLEYTHHLAVEPVEFQGGFSLKVIIKGFKTIPQKYLVRLQKIGITPETPAFWIDSTPVKMPLHYYAQVRSVLELLNYLSKGVVVPPDHLKQHVARTTYDKNHKVFDWHVITRGQIKVLSSRMKPDNDYLSVRYHGYWFYIADDDFHTKETLNIVSVIMGIYQGDVKSVLPVFTVS